MTYPMIYKASPNHSSRNGAAIRAIVLHATVGSYKSSLAWLCSPASGVSIHYLIDRDGSIAQLVTEDRCAWHAGSAKWQSYFAVNELSLGIELVNLNDGRDPYPLAQLDSCRDLCRNLIARYNIKRAGIVRHLDIATPKGRKTDPKGFPFAAFVDSLYAPIPHPPIPLGHYQVKRACTGGATIRAYPRVNAAILGRLHAGDSWDGEPIEADAVTTLAGFGSSRIWVRSLDMRCVWSGLLERVK